MWDDPFLLKVEQFPDRLVQWSTAAMRKVPLEKTLI